MTTSTSVKTDRTFADCGLLFCVRPRSPTQPQGASAADGVMDVLAEFPPVEDHLVEMHIAHGIARDREIAAILDIDLDAVRLHIVHGADGLDELSVTGVNSVSYLRDGDVTTCELDPEAFGLQKAVVDELVGGEF